MTKTSNTAVKLEDESPPQTSLAPYCMSTTSGFSAAHC